MEKNAKKRRSDDRLDEEKGNPKKWSPGARSRPNYTTPSAGERKQPPRAAKDLEFNYASLSPSSGYRPGTSGDARSSKESSAERCPIKGRQQQAWLDRSESSPELTTSRKRSIAQLQKENQELLNEFEAFQAQRKRDTARIAKLDKELERLLEENRYIETEKDNYAASLTMTEKECCKYREKSASQEEKIIELSRRLSEEIGRRVDTDPNMEQVSDTNRPLALRDRYDCICSEQWLEAKEWLDDVMEEVLTSEEGQCTEGEVSEEVTQRFKCEILATVFLEAQRMAEKTLQTLLGDLGNIHQFRQPFDVYIAHVSGEKYPKVENRTVPSSSNVSKDLKKCVVDLLRSHATSVDTSSATEELMNNVFRKLYHLPEEGHLPCPVIDLEKLATRCWDSEELKGFTQGACHLAWCMVLQTPSMCFGISGLGRGFDENTQKAYYSCNKDDRDSVVTYYIYPALYQADRLLVPGTVFLESGKHS